MLHTRRAMSFWGNPQALQRLFENNKKWRDGKKLLDPDYFDKTSKGQHPQYLWIGCSDSRVPAEEITGLAPGEMFVHRNIANMVVANDVSALSVVQYAVEFLKVKDIIVCGHYGCGGVRAAMDNKALGLLDNWLRNIRDVCRTHHHELTAIPDDEQRLNRMIELNTVEQCMNIFKIGFVQRHQAKYGFPRIHGLVYNIKNGEVKELDVDFQAYVKQYSSIYKLHSFNSPDPSGYSRAHLQGNAVRSICELDKHDDGRVSVTFLKQSMQNEPLLFSASEIDGAIAEAQKGEKDKNFPPSTMVKRKKHDKDKYYNLARQQGYRARSAFKLIQLNKKYDFLSTAKVCIDLCAAPGGWCQVAAKYMPASSIILGIDLLPIRPIRGVKTYQCDITTTKCRQIIKQEMQSWQADVVLCDGAPNVGAEYSKDAYVQNELALVALKLAVDVMGRGATFVSKVFRSQDYNALLWVFKQLFKKVSATKPLSSRNESAEIFVVCEQYLAPHSIDPKLFDPKHVFEQLGEQEKTLTIFHPKFGVQKRHRDGYDESLGQTLTNECTVSQFIDVADPIRLLTDSTAILFRETDEVFREHKDTTDEIIECLKDLKVLGKADFKNLLKWRLKIIQYKEELIKAQAPEKDEEEAAEASDDEDKEDAKPDRELTQAEKDALVREELMQLRANVLAKRKREKKK
ncbi:TPA: hypothetical protein N0F65_006574, partial [Lagenidium giganteum]